MLHSNISLEDWCWPKSCSNADGYLCPHTCVIVAESKSGKYASVFQANYKQEGNSAIIDNSCNI